MSENDTPTTSANRNDVPRGRLPEAMKYFKQDLVSGFLVFLIALPLCLAISVTSGYPPIAGIFTAIIGSIVTTFISNSELTIKGPAAGLIVIALGCINEFGGVGNPEAYRAALAVGVASAVLQIVFGMFRAGILGEFFPSSAVHGMLAAIGMIIIIKQIPDALGVIGAKGDPLTMIQHIPQYFLEANPAIAAIGIVSLLIMFAWPTIGRKLGPLKLIPGPMVVLLVAVPLGMGFDLLHKHSYYLQGHEYQLSEQYLVDMQGQMFGMFDEITYPNLSVLAQLKAWKWVLMFFIIGSLESLLSAKAVDLLDPWKRKTDMDRDMIAVGAGNLCASLVGGLPMISEIVRSKANIDNGARTRFADMWHGIFLLICVAMIPTVLHMIPLAALAAMLVYTGFRLAHPTEFIHVYHIGKEQLAIFVTTLVVVLATDLLIGVAAGILLKMIIHVSNGVPLQSLFKPYLEVEDVDDNTSMIIARQSAVFSNWIPFRRQIEDIGLVQRRNLIIDVSDTRLVDHSVMGKLEEMSRDFEQEGLSFEVRGLETLQPLADSAQSARKRGLATIRRITVMANQSLRFWLLDEFVKCGVTGYTLTTCTGAGRRHLESDSVAENEHVRIEIIAPADVCDAVIEFLRRDILPDHHVTACVETVDVVRIGHFAPVEEEVTNGTIH
ncbi:MAG: SulP family inorganic anion transporter [Planctomycetota bacterium]|nr:SulP family inorganic anion transporter [Planctomycetota bacterium]